jgi:hypothetical protein
MILAELDEIIWFDVLFLVSCFCNP